MSSSEPASLGVLMFIWQTTEEKKHKNLELTLKYCVIKLLHSTVFEVGCVDEFKHQKADIKHEAISLDKCFSITVH